MPGTGARPRAAREASSGDRAVARAWRRPDGWRPTHHQRTRVAGSATSRAIRDLAALARRSPVPARDRSSATPGATTRSTAPAATSQSSNFDSRTSTVHRKIACMATGDHGHRGIGLDRQNRCTASRRLDRGLSRARSSLEDPAARGEREPVGVELVWIPGPQAVIQLGGQPKAQRSGRPILEFVRNPSYFSTVRGLSAAGDSR